MPNQVKEIEKEADFLAKPVSALIRLSLPDVDNLYLRGARTFCKCLDSVGSVADTFFCQLRHVFPSGAMSDKRRQGRESRGGGRSWAAGRAWGRRGTVPVGVRGVSRGAGAGRRGQQQGDTGWELSMVLPPPRTPPLLSTAPPRRAASSPGDGSPPGSLSRAARTARRVKESLTDLCGPCVEKGFKVSTCCIFYLKKKCYLVQARGGDAAIAAP